jgi:hypothetical protein
MPLVPIQRIVSTTSNTIGAANRAAAVTSALNGDAGNTVDVSNTFAYWPLINKYDDDNNPSFGPSPNPQAVWTQIPPVSGESHGFAVVSNVIPLSVGVANDFLIALTAFADNAHTLQIDAYNAVTLGLISSTTLGVPLSAGSLDPNSSNTTDTTTPYNWQRVRHYSILASLGLIAVAINVRFVISLEAVNYDSSFADNPAGVSFMADIYQDTLL